LVSAFVTLTVAGLGYGLYRRRAVPWRMIRQDALHACIGELVSGALHERWVLGAPVRAGLDARRRSRSGHLLQARTRLPICLYRYDFGARNSGAGEIKMRRIDYASRRMRSLISMYSWGYKCRETCMCAILTMTLLGGLSGGLHGMGVQPKLSIARSFVSLWRPRWNHPLTGWLQIFGS